MKYHIEKVVISMYGQTLNGNCAQSDPTNVQSARAKNCPSLFCRCSANVLCFLAFLFAGALGLILGAYFSATLLGSIAAVIVGAVILAILIIALMIYRLCNNCRFVC